MWLDQWAVYSLVPLVLWLVVSGLDDLFITATFLLGRRPAAGWPSAADLAAAPRRRIAVFIPLWREADVIGRMLEHNLAVIEYDNYDIFVGAYPNDIATQRAVSAATARHPQVHLALCPRPGPTSKADCLNAIYRAMQDFEAEQGVRFAVVATHDAEDLIHPQALAVIDYYSQSYDMVQIPVLPLPTPLRQLVHGLYCDEFAEYQSKDVPVRKRLGGFLPSNGVGAGFTRDVLDRLAAARGGRVFDPECLTEDYENGHAIHALGRPQIFVPLTRLEGGLAATREYFPSGLRGALRQRSRWVAGISLQGWERHGWELGSGQTYWLWRDRKGVPGNLVSPLANILFLYGVAGWARSVATGCEWGLARTTPGWLDAACTFTLLVAVVQAAVRTACTRRIYGGGFAALVPVRILVGNWLNCAATISALWQFAEARLRRRGLEWRKTDHVYPEGDLLKRHKPRLGEVLVRMRCLSPDDLRASVESVPPGTRLGEHLIHLQKISERNLYEALSLQSGIPREDPPGPTEALRVVPASVARRWKVLPVRVESGALHVGVSDLPPEELTRNLRRFCSLEIRYCLLEASRMERLYAAPTISD